LDYWPEKEFLASVSFDKVLRVFSTVKRAETAGKEEEERRSEKEEEEVEMEQVVL
jgi:hypothetical protein